MNNKKKIIFILNHFQQSDGVARSLINLVNIIDLNIYDITIKPMYICDKQLGKEELQEGIRLESFIGTYFRGLAKILRFIPIKVLYKLVVRDNYDIEIAYQCDMPTFIVANSLNKKAIHIAWMHGYQIYPKEYKEMDKIVCVSKYCMEKAKRELPGYQNIIYKYNIVPDEKIKELSKEDIPYIFDKNDGVIFISVGRHSHEKGYLRLINILSELKYEGYNFKLILVGDGPEHMEIVKNTNLLGLSDNVILVGEEKNPHKYTAKSDVFICSSYSEGYSTVCTESAILGIPILTTDVPGGKEIIDECECGILSDNNDESLKENLKYILENKTIIKEWKQTMACTSEKFTLHNRKIEIDKFFQEICKMSSVKGEEKDE